MYIREQAELHRTLFAPLIEGNASTTQSSEDDDDLPLSLMDRIKKLKTATKPCSEIPLSQPANFRPLEQKQNDKPKKLQTKKLKGEELFNAMQTVLLNDAQMLNKILQYIPIYLSDIREIFLVNGIKHSSNSALDFLDQKVGTRLYV